MQHGVRHDCTCLQPGGQPACCTAVSGSIVAEQELQLCALLRCASSISVTHQLLRICGQLYRRIGIVYLIIADHCSVGDRCPGPVGPL